MKTFSERLVARIEGTGARACIGLDPHLDRLPATLRQRYQDRSGEEYYRQAAAAVLEFNRAAIAANVP